MTLILTKIFQKVPEGYIPHSARSNQLLNNFIILTA